MTVLSLGLATSFQPLSAQALKLSDAAVPPGGRVSLDLTLLSPSHAQPSALQWEMSFPVDCCSLIEGFPKTGEAAEAADKGVSCTTRQNTADTRTILCVLYGGQKPIPNGVVAKLDFRIAPRASAGQVHIKVDKGLAVSVDLKRTTIPAAEGIITVRPQ